MKINSGKVMYWKFTAKSCPERINGSRAMTNITIKIIILKAIIRYLNFNGYAPIIAINRSIKERLFYVNGDGNFAAGAGGTK